MNPGTYYEWGQVRWLQPTRPGALGSKVADGEPKLQQRRTTIFIDRNGEASFSYDWIDVPTEQS